VADLSGALWSAVGILFALLERERSGLGQRVEASLLGGALSFLPLAVVRHQAGQPMARGSDDLNGGVICYNIYETQDGHHMTLSALEPEFWANFCQAVGREDLMGQQFSPALPGEPAYEELCALFRSRGCQDWVEALARADTCCEPIFTVGEALDSPPVQALGMMAGVGLFAPLHLSNREKWVAQPAPELGQDTMPILTELGYDPAAVEELCHQGVI
jgi:crotonobetainyl-CoA:carnitine CoA-transferase CaiB-like acyl-CoA transferase